jgi:hypothetical protein
MRAGLASVSAALKNRRRMLGPPAQKQMRGDECAAN